MSRFTSALRFTLGSLALVAAAQVSGCANVLGIDSDPQLVAASAAKCTGTIYVRIHSDFSGTATDIAIPHFFGIYDYLRKLNDTGGIRGCKLDIGVADNKYSPTTEQQVYDDARANDPNWSKVSTLFLFGTGPTTKIANSDEYKSDRKIMIPGSYAGSLASPTPVSKTVSYVSVAENFSTSSTSEQKASIGYPYIFFPATDYSTAIRIAMQAAWTIAPGRVAMAHEVADKCLYCVDPLAAGKAFVSSLSGMQLGRDLIIPQTSNAADEGTITTAVNAYFQAEVDKLASDATYVPVSWVWSGNSVMASSLLGKAVANAKKTLIDGDMRLTADQKKNWNVRVIANNWGIGETTPTICGTTCDDVVYGLFPVSRYGDLSSGVGMSSLVALHDEYTAKDTAANGVIPARTPGSYQDVRYVQGYVAALMWRKAIERAIETNRRNPTPDDIKAALETFNLEDMDGLTSGSVSFSATDHRPQSAATIYKLAAGGTFSIVNSYKIGLVDDWLGY